MRLAEAIKETIQESTHYWDSMDGAKLEDLEVTELSQWPHQYNKRISRIGLSILNKLDDTESDPKAEAEYCKLITKAHEHDQDICLQITRDKDLYFRMLFEQVAWASEDDINIAIAEMNRDEATRQGL